ncbi:MAG: SprT-like domain-containing protein [Gemmataceae bacterium]
MFGWFWEEKWKNGRPLRLPEINICPEYLAHDVEDIAQVLLHEMCHYANYLSGIRDCSSSQYHNRKFKRRCDSIGLVCTKSRRGWAHTELSPDLRAIVYRVKLDPGVFSLYRAGPQYRLVAAAPERCLRRWMCECKKSKVIYASRGLEVTCNKCFKVYQETPLGKY